MIKLHLGFDACRRPANWQWSGTRWTNGDSWIEPFAHPALYVALLTRDDRRAATIIVRERTCGVPAPGEPGGTLIPVAGWDAAHTAATAPDAAWLTATFRTSGRVEIGTGELAAAPLNLMCRDGVLSGSWDLLDFAATTTADDLDGVEATRFLTYRSVYSPRTLFAPITRLTERARAVFDGTLRFTLPEPALHGRPRELRPDADPVPFFVDLLDRVVARWEVDPAHCAVELSGGQDSSHVALALARATRPAPVVGALMLPDAPGVQQARRRKAMITLGGFPLDVLVNVGDFPPFHHGGDRAGGARVDPMEGTYDEATRILHRGFRDAGVHTVFTGAGGDEMLSLRVAERRALGLEYPDRPVPAFLGRQARALLGHLDEGRAPAAVLHHSTLFSFERRYPPTMREGLWPISPFATAEMVRLGEFLPAPWRVGKKLMREAMTVLGLPLEVGRPELQENFAPVIAAAMNGHGLDLAESVLPDSILTARRILDPDAIRALVDHARASGTGGEALCRPLLLELALRSWNR